MPPTVSPIDYAAQCSQPSRPSEGRTETVPSFGSGTGTDEGDGRSAIDIHKYFAVLITNV